MNCKEMVVKQLKEMGADGLCTIECGCGLDDLMPCGGEYAMDCKAAKAVPVSVVKDQDLKALAEAEGWDEIYLPLEEG